SALSLHDALPILRPEDIPAVLTELNEQDMTDGISVFRRVPGNQIRRISLTAELSDAEQIAPEGVPIAAVGYALGGTIERPTRSFISFASCEVRRAPGSDSRIKLVPEA